MWERMNLMYGASSTGQAISHFHQRRGRAGFR